MDLLLTLSGLTGLLTTGFVIGDFLNRRRLDRQLIDWRGTASQIQAVHNEQALLLRDLADRLAATEMYVKAGIGKR